jgi:2-(1,2-epoxy-1,2-dihydrophenyl)acetyl-CoA isomerase
MTGNDVSTSALRWEIAHDLGRIVIGRPGGLSTENAEFGLLLADAARSLGANHNVRAVVLQSAGTVFCAGLDLSLVPSLAHPRHSQLMLRNLNEGIACLAELPKPVVAAVGGAAFGGGANLAMACDFIVASTKASICQAFVNIGLASDVGSLYLLPRRVGAQRARELLMTGRVVAAKEALAIGAVDEVVAPESLIARAEELAHQLGAGSPLALAAIKRGLYGSGALSLRDSLALEAEIQATQFASSDFQNAVKAFRAKQPPTFNGT